MQQITLTHVKHKVNFIMLPLIFFAALLANESSLQARQSVANPVKNGKKDCQHPTINDANAFTIDSKGRLVAFLLEQPNKIISQNCIVGLQPNESILGISFRPADGRLYALGSTSRLYLLPLSNLLSCPKDNITAVQVGTQFSTLLDPAATAFGFDFNPVVDRIRLVTNTRQNLVINPDTGALVGTPPTITPAQTQLLAVAYTDANPTTLFGLDRTSNGLGTLNTVTGLFTLNAIMSIPLKQPLGFTITPTTNIAYLLVTISEGSALYTVNLTTGVATFVSKFGCEKCITYSSLTTRNLPVAS